MITEAETQENVEADTDETAASETVVTELETEEPETDQPETEEETDERVTESETQTESPKTFFTYQDNRVKITAVASKAAKLPQDAVLRADYLEPGSNAYKTAVAAIEAQLSAELKADQENAIVDFVLYDIYFLSVSENRRIEPEEGNVKVEMTILKTQEASVDGEIINKDVVHLKNNGEAEIVTDYINTNAEGEVTSLGFTQDSFSIIGGATTYDVKAFGGASSENTITNPIIVFKKTSSGSEIDTVKSGDPFILQYSMGFAHGTGPVVGTDIRIDLGVTDAEFPDFTGNGVSDGATFSVVETYTEYNPRTGKTEEKEYTITYVLNGKQGEHRYITATVKGNNGDTLSMDFQIKFPAGTTENGETITATLQGNNKDLASDTVTAEAAPTWAHNKSADKSELGTVHVQSGE